MKTNLKVFGTRMGNMLAVLVVLLTAFSCEKEPVIQEEEKEEEKIENTLSVDFTEIEVDAQGEEIKIPLTTNAPLAEPTVTHDWMTASVSEDSKSLLVNAQPNKSGKARSGHVTLSTDAKEGEQAKVTVKVMQEPLDAATLFHFAQDNYPMGQNAGEIQVSVISSGKWELSQTEKVPGWLEITPTSGDGDASITIKYTENIMQSERKANVLFTNTDINHSAILNLTQAPDPTGLISFSHLGRGYDACGMYAYDSEVKAAVLDPLQLFDADAIAKPDKLFQTEEEYITGTTREEYTKKYTASAGIEGTVAGFTGSINSSFSKDALENTENSFCTFRHLTKKQVIKTYENLKAEDLIPYLSETFIADLKTLSGTKIVEKYGTHVILGLSIGGVLEYSMTADMSETSLSTSLDVTAKAGFENLTFNTNTSAGYSDLETIKKNDSTMEHKLICRGGDSQFASNGKDNSQSTYDQWLTSLKEPEKWVMVDYEGNMLVELDKFITDPTKAQEVKTAIADYQSVRMLPNQTPKWGRFFVEWTDISINCVWPDKLLPKADYTFIHNAEAHMSRTSFILKETMNGTERKLYNNPKLSASGYISYDIPFGTKNANPTFKIPGKAPESYKINTRKENNYVFTMNIHFSEIFQQTSTPSLVSSLRDSMDLDYILNLKFNPAENKWEDTKTHHLYGDGDMISICAKSATYKIFQYDWTFKVTYNFKIHWDRKVN